MSLPLVATTAGRVGCGNLVTGKARCGVKSEKGRRNSAGSPPHTNLENHVFIYRMHAISEDRVSGIFPRGKDIAVRADFVHTHVLCSKHVFFS